MNERIKELAEQAGFFVLSNGKIYIPTTSEEITDCQTKFAELIVKECAEQCTTDGPFVAEVVWGKQFHKKILEHFGVEE